MKIGDLILYKFRHEEAEQRNPRGVGVVVSHANDYRGRKSSSWFNIQWSNGMKTQQTSHHCEIIKKDKKNT